jgi:hypothetical protein
MHTEDEDTETEDDNSGAKGPCEGVEALWDFGRSGACARDAEELYEGCGYAYGRQ